MVPPLPATPVRRQQWLDDTPGFLRQLPTSNQLATLFPCGSSTRVAHPRRFVRHALIALFALSPTGVGRFRGGTPSGAHSFAGRWPWIARCCAVRALRLLDVAGETADNTVNARSQC